MEETRRLVREYVDELDDEKYKDPHLRSGSQRWKQVSSDLNAIDRDVRMSVYLEMIAERPDDPATVNRMVRWFNNHDGYDRASHGNQKALDWARKILKSEDSRLNAYIAGEYLMFKGDARDLDIIRGDAEVLAEFGVGNKKDFDIFAGDFKETLAMRVAGTNIINYVSLPTCMIPDYFNCIPSVTNTGPQGLYVQEILHQVWKTLEIEECVFEGLSVSLPFRDKSKIPPELITMVMWFDDDGNPVCNVDLAKYGLTMPEIDLPQNVRDEILRRTRPNVATASLPSADDAPPNRLWLYTALLAILCATVALWFIRKKKPKR